MRRYAFMSMVAAFALATPSGAGAQGPDADTLDIVLEGGKIVDGTGNAAFYGDLGIRGDRIVRITRRGLLREWPARQRFDVTGLVVAPGFIDIQSHSRFAFLNGDGRVVSKVTQGITTEILGEGETNAPANDKTLPRDWRDQPAATRRQLESFTGPHGFDAWLRAMEARGTSSNVGSFLGGHTVRVYAKGRAMGPATSAELDTMRAVTRRAMRDGAFGVATALIYPPGNYASTEELIEVAKAMAPFGGVYISHIRSEADQYLEALDEAIRIGVEGRVPVEIYHLKAAGRRNWPKAAQAIAKIDSARAAGFDVQANMYPYVAGSTGLTACFPPWASESGRLMQNLADEAIRARIRAEVMQEVTDWENLCQLASPEGVLILGLFKPENRQWTGKRLQEIAEAQGKSWVDAAADLIVSESQRVGTVYFLMSEENVALQLRQPWIKFGTDAGGIDPANASSLAHPRAYGTFPRILGHYVRDEGVLSLEDAVRKATSAVATRLQIQDRGLLKPGFHADIVVFDAEEIRDVATFEAPHRVSEGIEYVFVNGVGVVHRGRHTGAKPGRVVRGPGYQVQTPGAGRP